uniref:Uncharacterized protein n=1 Tax=Anguilla anguilla TaxID=7936 RepID=A0A0E9VS62_ANGAN
MTVKLLPFLPSGYYVMYLISG